MHESGTTLASGGGAPALPAMPILPMPDVGNVIETLSGAEQMPHENLRAYFAVGQSALRCVRSALVAAGKSDVQSILDLACGNGRVLRMLKAAFPEARLTACDVLRDGVDFCARTFKATPVYAGRRPTSRIFPDRYDLIFCGSLLTHLRAPLWNRFLNVFADVLLPGGIAVFTTHGPFVAHRMREGDDYGYRPAKTKRAYWRLRRMVHAAYEPADARPHITALLKAYDRTGFGYLDDGSGHYGITLSAPTWVARQIAGVPGLRLVGYAPQAWDAHQDAFAVARI